ncbi:MAG: NADH-quinone oxidoreductase subunit N [Dissulfurispiraceae bacterium]
MEFWSQLQVIKPELCMAVLAMVVLLLELVFKEKDVLALLSVLTIVIVGFVTLRGSPGVVFNSMFIADNYSLFFKIIFLSNALLTIFISVRYLKVEEAHFGEYYSLILFSTLGMMIMASAGDLIVLYLGLELMALSTYILAGFKRDDPRSNEAALKYFLLGAFSSAILLYGISMIYSVTGTTVIRDIALQLSRATLIHNAQLLIGLTMLIVAFGFKIAAAPFHMWAPDVYEGAPTPVTAFMSVGPKAAGFAILARVFLTGFEPVAVDWQFTLSILAVLTMAVGNILALTQTNIKRMLAYSSIAHAGYMLLGVIPGTTEAMGAMMLYMLIYAFMNIGAFTVIILLNSKTLKGEELSDYEGLGKTHPILGALMLIFMFSLTGIPPTAGFVGKFYLFLAVINAGYAWLAIVAVIFSAISAFFYLRVVMLMYMKDPQRDVHLAPSATETVAAFFTTIMVLVIGIFPSYFIQFAMSSIIL